MIPEAETVYEQALQSNLRSIINSEMVGLHMSPKDHKKDFAHSNHDKSTDRDIVLHKNHEQLNKKFYEEELSKVQAELVKICLLYTSPSPRDRQKTRMPSSA